MTTDALRTVLTSLAEGREVDASVLRLAAKRAHRVRPWKHLPSLKMFQAQHSVRLQAVDRLEDVERRLDGEQLCDYSIDARARAPDAGAAPHFLP